MRFYVLYRDRLMKVDFRIDKILISIKDQTSKRTVIFVDISEAGTKPIIEHSLMPTYSGGNVYFKVSESHYSDCGLSNTKYTGIAIHNPSDKFNLDFGRKLALKRVLKYFSRDFRSLAWNGYFETVRDENRYL